MHIDFPLHIDGLGRTAQTSDADWVRDMIEQLLFTSPGERVNRPDFGSGLLQAIFAPNSRELATALEFTTRAALQRWLADVIDVHRLEFEAVDSTLRVSLEYTLRQTGERRVDAFARSAAA